MDIIKNFLKKNKNKVNKENLTQLINNTEELEDLVEIAKFLHFIFNNLDDKDQEGEIEHLKKTTMDKISQAANRIKFKTAYTEGKILNKVNQADNLRELEAISNWMDGVENLNTHIKNKSANKFVSEVREAIKKRKTQLCKE